MVKTAYQLGDRPAIDTLEAATQLQLFEQQETEAEMLLKKSKLQLSLYLWTETALPYALPEDAVPETAQLPPPASLDSLLSEASAQPSLVRYSYELSALSIDRQLKFQSLLPQVTAKYNALASDFSKAFNSAFFNNNYRFGLAVSMPLRLSEGRGAFRAAKLKIAQTKIAQRFKQQTVENKVKTHYVEWQQTQVQYQQQQKLVQNYINVQRGEETSLLLAKALFSLSMRGRQRPLKDSVKNWHWQRKRSRLWYVYNGLQVRLVIFKDQIIHSAHPFAKLCVPFAFFALNRRYPLT